jgi:oligoribonuclease NrnB/cAMP/cGMP phosphodiesterase (DHH superfamily)
MNVLIFSHESDLDGLLSAAIGLIRYPQARTIFLGNGTETFRTIAYFVSRLAISSPRRDKGLIIICDLALSNDASSISLCKSSFSDARNAGFEIVWLDHHPWPDSSRASIQPYAELKLDITQSKCAAELMYEKFLHGNESAFTLASMAHSMDFFKRELYLTPLSELIVYYLSSADRYDRMSSLAAKVSRGILWDLEMQKDYTSYAQLRDKAKAESFQTLEVRRFGDKLKAAILRSSPYIQNSLFAHEIFEKTGSDVVMLYGPDNKVSIRRNNDQISCRNIALNFPEGGGHDFAAGAKFRSAIGDHDQLVRELEEALSKAAAEVHSPQ